MTITKKWKCASVCPSQRWTSTAEQVSSPTHTIADRPRRPNRGMPAARAHVATGTTSNSACPAVLPVASAKASSAGTCSQRITVIARCRLAQIAGGSVCPRGSRSRQRTSCVMVGSPARMPMPA